MADKDFRDLNRKSVGEPADSSREVISGAAPIAAKQQHQPADVAETEHGEGTLGPANYYSEEAGEKEPFAPEPAQPGGSAWKNYLWPVATLVAICLVVSTLLAFTYNTTNPIFEDNQRREAEETRMALLPEADSFTEITPSPLPDGILAMYEADNGAGHVVQSYAVGYGGRITALVAFDEEGTIAGVSFVADDETPGLGQNITKDSFQSQFAGRESEAITLGDIDTITSATISSGAAVTAVNKAVDLYNELVGGSVKLSPEEQRLALLPGADSIEEITVVGAPAGTLAAYKAGNNAGYVIETESQGYGGWIQAMVGFDESGTITGVYFTHEKETDGLGSNIVQESFTGQFAGKAADGPLSLGGDIDALASATISSQGALDAVNTAIEAYNLAKEAA